MSNQESSRLKPIQVGLLGIGTVGSGTFKVLQRNQNEIQRRAGRAIQITMVADLDTERAKAVVGDGVQVVGDARAVIANPEIDIVIELIGGYGIARTLVLEAIAAGKHVVTANKALLAVHGTQIFAAARERGVVVAFEAAVAGGIPIIKALREGLTANRIEWIAGIINGTTNFILSEMRAKGLDFADVLKEAQRLGYAEADPTFDIEGVDAAHKATLMSAIAFGIPVQFDKAYVEGITKLNAADIRYAEQLGYRIKLLGITKRRSEGIELRVHPTLIPAKRLIANVEGAMNAVVVQGDAVGATLYYGKGAGSEPTASAVIADLVDITRLHSADPGHRVPYLAFQPDSMHDTPILPMESVVTSFYLRLQVADQAGVLARITGILAEHGISIDALLQRESAEGEAQTDVIILTHDTVEGPMNKAIALMQALPTVLAPIVRIRKEELELKYLSTRGDNTERGFSDILLEGLAPDGGLYLPAHYPPVKLATLTRWRGLSYADLAHEILALYIDDIPRDDLKALAHNTYTEATFGTPQITPLKPLGEGVWLQALSNGPTLAFKDMAMQLLGNLFEYELARRGQVLNILGATSGDTGSAAEYAMRGKRGVNVFMLSPHGRMSPFQQAQMFSLQDPNIHNIAVEGVFDDCQDIVKAVSNDLEFKRRHHIGTVNSINWARLLAQVVYYFAGYFQATTSNAEAVSFAVPSGNFGNICAGHVARMMGLPIRRLVLATNENKVLDEFFRTGTYRVRKSAETHETSSPSMDISKASNFERFVFDLLGRDAPRTAQLFKTEVEQRGSFTLTPEEFERIVNFGFVSGSSTHADRVATIRETERRFATVIDTHTADGVKVAREHLDAGVPMIVLETALPAKVAATIVEALGREPERPAAMAGIEDLPKRYTVMAPDVQQVKRFITVHV